MTISSDTVLSAEFINEVTEHMNSDHADSLKDYAAAFAAVDWADSVRMTSLTVNGIELLCLSASGGNKSVHVEFAKALNRPEQVRGALVAMAKEARQINRDKNG